MERVYERNPRYDINYITHLIYKKNGKVIKIQETLSLGDNPHENKIDTIKINKEEEKEYKQSLNSDVFKEFSLITPKNYIEQLIQDQCIAAALDQSAYGVIISSNNSKNHYQQYVPFALSFVCRNTKAGKYVSLLIKNYELFSGKKIEM